MVQFEKVENFRGNDKKQNKKLPKGKRYAAIIVLLPISKNPDKKVRK